MIQTKKRVKIFIILRWWKSSKCVDVRLINTSFFFLCRGGQHAPICSKRSLFELFDIFTLHIISLQPLRQLTQHLPFHVTLRLRFNSPKSKEGKRKRICPITTWMALSHVLSNSTRLRINLHFWSKGRRIFILYGLTSVCRVITIDDGRWILSSHLLTITVHSTPYALLPTRTAAKGENSSKNGKF